MLVRECRRSPHCVCYVYVLFVSFSNDAHCSEEGFCKSFLFASAGVVVFPKFGKDLWVYLVIFNASRFVANVSRLGSISGHVAARLRRFNGQSFVMVHVLNLYGNLQEKYGRVCLCVGVVTGTLEWCVRVVRGVMCLVL